MPRLTTVRYPYPSAILRALRQQCVAARSLGRVAASFLRNLPLFFSARPRTPLRVLCIMAFDVRHRFHHAQPLSRRTRATLAALLDLGAAANAALDGKTSSSHELHATLQVLKSAGLRHIAHEYLRRLRHLESRRPMPGGASRFSRIVTYRESVVRLSLAMVHATCKGGLSLDEAHEAITADDDLRLLFRIVMQCQIIDDVLDYPEDVAAQLPSFLTATPSLSVARALTRRELHRYAVVSNPPTPDAFVWNLVLRLVSTAARFILFTRHRPVPLHPATRASPTWQKV